MTDEQVAEYLGVGKESQGTWNRIPKNIKALIYTIIESKISMEEDLGKVISNSIKGRIFLMDFGSTKEHQPLPVNTTIRFLVDPDTNAYVEIKNNNGGVELSSSKKMFVSPRTANIIDITMAVGQGFDGTQTTKPHSGRPRKMLK